MAAANYNDYFSEPTHWTDAAPDYTALMGAVGGAVATAAPAVARSMVNLAQRSPVVVAAVLGGDEGHIYVLHSPSYYPTDPTSASAFDGHLVFQFGNSVDTAVPICLPENAFQRIHNHRVLDVASITGPAGHGAAPPVYRSGPHAATVANTDEVSVHRVALLPSDLVDVAMTTANPPRYTLQGFFGSFLQPTLTGGDAAAIAAIEPLRDWWRVASTNTAAGANVARIDQTMAATPMETRAMADYVSGLQSFVKSRLGLGGPALTTAAFNTGVTDLRATLDANAQAALAFERARGTTTFTDKHGTQLAQRMYNLCNATDDASLPEVHRLLAAAPKNRDYGILGNLFAERAVASAVPLTAASAPLATTKLVDDVFRSFRPSGTGLTFGQGLTPFAIVCEGHKEMAEVRKLVKQAELTEAGTSMTLHDAETLTTADVRFPSTAQVGAEKLYGWSVAIDVFHGNTHAVAVSIRSFSVDVGPCLHRIFEQLADSPAVGMDLVNRVLFEAQQDYFQWATAVANGQTGVTIPTFGTIRQKVLSYRVDSLSPLPAGWYSMVDAPLSSRRARGTTTETSPRQQAGAVATFNRDADPLLMRRFRDSSHTTISGMMEGKEVTVPKHANKDVCLVWALKGQCSATCKRKDQHVRYSRNTTTQLHQFLDACGVPNPQQ